MMTSVEFKTRFALILDGGLGLERLHQEVIKLRAAVSVNSPVLREIGWSPIEALRQIGRYEEMGLRETAVFIANQLFDGEPVENLGAISDILAQAEVEGKIVLAEIGLSLDEAGQIVLSPQAKKRLAEAAEQTKKKGTIIPFEPFRQKRMSGSI